MKFTRTKHRGLATMMVIIIVAMASLIGMAMLSSSALQQEVADSSSRGAASDYLAESAVQAAAFYLQNPAKLPANWVNAGYALYVRGATISGVIGSFDADATATSKPDVYQIHAVGYSGTSVAPTRTEAATIQLIHAVPTVPAEFGGPLNIPNNYTISGPILANGNITKSVSAVTGPITTSLKSSDFVVPTSGNVNYYGGNVGSGTYTMSDGTIGYPQTIAAGSTITTNLTPAANNPGGIFYCPGALTLSATGTLSISGTLIVHSTSNLVVKSAAGTAATVVVAPVKGFPAIVTDKQLQISGKNIGLIANGVVWIGNSLTWAGVSGAGSSIVINGALIMPSGGSLPAPTTGAVVSINYVAANVNVLNMTTTASPEPITGIKLQSWTQ